MSDLRSSRDISMTSWNSDTELFSLEAPTPIGKWHRWFTRWFIICEMNIDRILIASFFKPE